MLTKKSLDQMPDLVHVGDELRCPIDSATLKNLGIYDKEGDVAWLGTVVNVYPNFVTMKVMNSKTGKFFTQEFNVSYFNLYASNTEKFDALFRL